MRRVEGNIIFNGLDGFDAFSSKRELLKEKYKDDKEIFKLKALLEESLDK